ncbi:MAG: hypothetical protein RBT75_15770 [Anaerolineae bacterium]|jgi:hypothetical protein|nr:hypothetical protein [Anaerolineae bacterium]
MNTLDIGGIALTLQGPEHWLAPLNTAWAEWQSSIAGVQVQLLPDETLPTPTCAYFEARPRFVAGVCNLEVPGFVGRIDAEAGTATLRAHPTAAGADLVYFIRTAFALAAFEQGALLVHGAGIVHHEVAFILYGLSGSGKSTAAALSTGKPVLNDDLLLVRPTARGWEVLATPFGRRRVREVTAAPLRALLRLVQAPNDALATISSAQALAELVANSPVINADIDRAAQLFERWQGILEKIPAYRLHFRKANTFWEVIDAHFG